MPGISVTRGTKMRRSMPIRTQRRPRRILTGLIPVILWIICAEVIPSVISQDVKMAGVETDQDATLDSDHHQHQQADIPDSNEQGEKGSEDDVVVDDYLQTLSDEELLAICQDRGFDIRGDEEDGSLTRQDLVEGARRCLNLEDEMNAILAQNPELAAELDAEIERMKRSKEELEREREAILAEKALLEEQLRKAGVDIGASDTSVEHTGGMKDVANMTFEEVFRESMVQLFDRVAQDVRFVRKILDPILIRPVSHAVKLLWRYSKPILKEAYEKAHTFIMQQIENQKQKQKQQQEDG